MLPVPAPVLSTWSHDPASGGAQRATSKLDHVKLPIGDKVGGTRLNGTIETIRSGSVANMPRSLNLDWLWIGGSKSKRKVWFDPKCCHLLPCHCAGRNARCRVHRAPCTVHRAVCGAWCTAVVVALTARGRRRAALSATRRDEDKRPFPPQKYIRRRA